MKIWLEIISEWLVNISAGWFAVAVIEPNFNQVFGSDEIASLTLRFTFGIVSLMLAKLFRERSRL
jgi:hypothetical protein